MGEKEDLVLDAKALDDLENIDLDLIAKEEEEDTKTFSLLPTSEGDYSQYTGLHIEHSQFSEHVMHFEELKVLFADNALFHARFAYPYLPVDGFSTPPTFSVTKIKDEEHQLKLVSTININEAPQSKQAKIARKTLPSTFLMYDRLTFFKGEQKGKFKITTTKSSHTITRLLLASKKRDGLFLKVSKQGGEYYNDVVIYFPARPTSALQRSAAHAGQAFVLVREGLELTYQISQNISNTFDQLIKDVYGELGGLHHVETHQPIKAYLESIQTSTLEGVPPPKESPSLTLV